ncbi:hypothetical protein BC351_10340 [Paenibacillus ferrarius]|uniref:Uncharacterized protein n=1 Tax=Paenibacillus ferrarius TaxID=1469647 RepID=A0A1V4H9D6_9BACL|nr:hypothetical protein [Paenibacillus ferrarius]OPH47582.1 hypothetical protein BC351_10340 [Paenibacillus ferrarius]
MNIDKVKVLRYVSLLFVILGIANKVAGHYGYQLPEAELEFWADVVSAIATLVFGITLDSKVIQSLFKSKSGV